MSFSRIHRHEESSGPRRCRSCGGVPLSAPVVDALNSDLPPGFKFWIINNCARCNGNGYEPVATPASRLLVMLGRSLRHPHC